MLFWSQDFNKTHIINMLLVTLMLMLSRRGITSIDRNFIPCEMEQYSPVYNDTCDYSAAADADVVKCGDLCMPMFDTLL